MCFFAQTPLYVKHSPPLNNHVNIECVSNERNRTANTRKKSYLAFLVNEQNDISLKIDFEFIINSYLNIAALHLLVDI